ncbi:DUF6493 family protein [Streptomyces bambusae]|uniref:DUF6493 family protein n=1 Tax=Streptomyces bambusae TaxID=1550616 RepID=UPI001CFEBDA7|nr:DUF6493 family protein [Streptomyces bambusae]MCB5167516.1 DUF6493 family protein [Streptomyces bambusae]
MNALLDAVRAGRPDLVGGLLDPLSEADRRGLLPELTALRREVRGWDWSRRWDEGNVLRALHLAGAGCHTGAAAAAAWIAARELREGRQGPDAGALAAVLAGRAPAWRADVAHRLAGRATTVTEDYPLIRALLADTGAPVPASDGFVHAWVGATATGDGGARRRSRDAGRPGPLRVALREDPCVRELVLLLFETAEPAPGLGWYEDPAAPGRWPAELARLAAEGVVERGRLVDGSVARLLRGGRAGQLRFYADLLDVLELTVDEQAERTSDWIALAADAESPLAGRAQRILSGLSEAGRLPAGRLAEMSSAVLFRPEKKLVRAQLVLLGKALRRGRDDRSVLLPAVAAAFGHADAALQERALKLVAAHLRPEDGALREELACEAEQLGPGLRRAACELLGGDVPVGPADGYEETLPAPPGHRRLGVGGSVAETVELVAALLHSSSPDVVETESALDLLVRHAHRDRAALAAALQPAVADRYWAREGMGRTHPDHLAGLELVAAAVLDRLDVRGLRAGGKSWPAGSGQDCVHEALDRVEGARAHEVALRMPAEPLPFLLATPSWDSGSLEPLDLVERLAEYRRLGVRPAPVDFAQALLRLRHEPEAAPAAAGLGTPWGDRLAQWLGDGGSSAGPERLFRRVEQAGSTARYEGGWRQETVGRVVVEAAERPAFQALPPVFHRLGRPFSTHTVRCWHWVGGRRPYHMVLPEDRETQALWLLPDLTAGATLGERRAGAVLSALAELGGPAGPVLHLAVATGLGARHAEDRLAAVDALLVLAARGELDAVRLGRDLAELLELGTVKPNRLADAARTAAATGAFATTWAVLSTALPAVLTAGPPRGAGDVLAVAADCAERCAAAGPMPDGLAAAAARKGTSQLVTQARRLRDALGAAC